MYNTNFKVLLLSDVIYLHEHDSSASLFAEHQYN